MLSIGKGVEQLQLSYVTDGHVRVQSLWKTPRQFITHIDLPYIPETPRNFLKKKKKLSTNYTQMLLAPT